MCADLDTVFIFELIAIAESSGSKIEIFIHGGAACPASRSTGYGPFPEPQMGGCRYCGTRVNHHKFSPQGAIVSASQISANNHYPLPMMNLAPFEI